MRMLMDTSSNGRSVHALWAATILLLLCPLFASVANAAHGNERIIFLHHSTGANLYSQGGVAAWISGYNSDHGTDYQITERAYPDSPYPWNNYPYDYWNLWINQACDSGDSHIECMSSLTQNYDVIIFKHCFPGADVLADTGSADIASNRKSLENYKLQYRALRDLMDGYPDNQFIVWTLVPEHRLATNTQNAGRARQFVDWVKNEWLGEDGQAHDNIHIFDFWGYAAEDDPAPLNGQVNTLRYAYEGSHSGSDSHPNQLANETIGPIFAQFIVDTIDNGVQADCTPENIRCVPGEYATLGAAATVAADGDTIQIQAGTYTGPGIVAALRADNLTVRGVDGRAHLNAQGVAISNGKAILVTTGDHITIENMEFSNARVPDQNGAGIRHEGGLLTLRNCYFHDNEDGILTSQQANGELLIENSEFNHNGLGDAGYTHNIYVGRIAKFTMQYSYCHHAVHGHNVKSRAEENNIRYNRIMDEATGNASYQIDIPNGGLTTIIGNILHQGPNAENSNMISYAAEGPDNPVQALYVSANTLVNDLPGGKGIRLAGSPTAIVVNNIFDHIAADAAVQGDVAVYDGNVVGDANYFANRSNYDYHLSADSPAVGAAGDPGANAGVDLTPQSEYVHPLSSRPREAGGRVDAGAFGFSDGTSSGTDTPVDNPSLTDPGSGGSGAGENNGSSGGCFIETAILP